MKTLLFFLFFTLALLSLVAAPVAPEDVIALVDGFTQAKQPGYTFSNLFPIYNDEANSEPLYYIATLKPRGFVIVSNNTMAIPIIGFSFTENYSAEDMPDNLRWFFSTIEEQLSAAQNLQLSPHPEWQAALAGDFSRYQSSRSVSPLLQTTWNQNYPYNAACPSDGSGRAYAGCVATAMGQIMKYWSYPASGAGSYSYSSSYGTLSADFASSTFNWSAMPNSISSENTHISSLLYKCGVACHMAYSASGSFATGANAIHAAIANFGYNPNAQGLYKDNFPLATWNTMLQTELNNSRPIGYSGGTGYTAHAFVLDGYQATDYYHVNWGWGGYLNGYFYLNNLVPQAGYNFTSNQAGIFNLVPAPNPPSASTAQIAASQAQINWNAPATTNHEANWLKWGGCREYQSFGFTSAANFEIAIRFPVASLSGYSNRTLEQVRFVAGMAAATYTVKVYCGGSISSPGTLMHSQSIPSINPGSWNVVTLSSPVTITGTQEVWIALSVSQPSAGYPVSFDYGPMAADTGNKIKVGSNAWTTMNALNSSLVYNWLLIGVMNSPDQRTEDRALAGYKVWRLTPAQIANPAVWTLLTPSATSSTSFSDSSWEALSSGDYLWAIKAIHTLGIESEPAFTNTLGKLDAPQLLLISHNTGNNRIYLSWQAVSGADTYQIYRASNPQATFSLAGTSAVPSWSHLPVAGDRCWFYKVIAVGD